MKLSKKKTNRIILVLGIVFVILFLLRFVFDICNIWICLSGIGVIVIWQILQDYQDHDKK